MQTNKTLSDSWFPLSYGQEGVWFDHHAAANAAQSNLLWEMGIEGELKPEQLDVALALVVERHAQLRVVFHAHNGRLMQRELPTTPDFWALEYADLGKASPTEIHDDAVAFGLREYSLTAGPLCRFRLQRCGKTQWNFLAGFHHLVIDGPSWSVFVRDLMTALRGEPFTAPDESYAVLVERQRSSEFDKQIVQAADWWRGQAANTTASWTLPLHRIPAGKRSKKGGDPCFPSSFFNAIVHKRSLSQAARDALMLGVEKLDTSPFRLMFTVYLAALATFLGLSKLSSITSMKGRDRRTFDHTVGFFVTSGLVRADVAQQTNLEGLLHAVSSQLDQAQRWEQVPLVCILRALHRGHTPGQTPFSPVDFTWTPKQLTHRFGDCVVTERRIHLPIAHRELSCYCERRGEDIDFTWVARTDRVTTKALDEFFDVFELMLIRCVKEPARPFRKFARHSSRAAHQVLTACRGPSRYYNHHQAIHVAISAQAKRTPKRIALVSGSHRFSYDAIERHACEIAARLAARGVKQGDLLPLMMKSSPALLIAELAAMKLGVTFVPVDPDWPAQRIRYVLAASHASIVLQADGVDGAITIRRLPGSQKSSQKTDSASTEAPLYCIFTSGTTGRPKGAMNWHDGINNRLCAMTETFGNPHNEVILATSQASADSLVWQYFWPLKHGGRVVLTSPRMLANPVELLKLCDLERVTITDFVPTYFTLFLAALHKQPAQIPAMKHLRLILMGGESMNAADVGAFKAQCPWVEVVNTYGPTEASIGTLMHRVGKQEGESVPIGRPLPNVNAYILDEHARLAPFGVAGELCLGGDCVGAGYLGDVAATAEKFGILQLPDNASDRIYHTGDVAWLDRKGRFHYLGRHDDQIQINGIRTELAEIEGALNSEPEIAAAAVLPLKNQRRISALTAHLVLSPDGSELTADVLRARLLLRLPRHMVPVSFFVLDQLPFTTTGKIDRQALMLQPGTAMGLSTTRASLTERGARRDENKSTNPVIRFAKLISWIWSQQLDKRVGLDDDFFLDLGVDSLAALTFVATFQSSSGIALDMRQLYSASTARRLGENLTSRSLGSDLAETPQQIESRLRNALISWGGERVQENGWLRILRINATGQPLFWCGQSFHEIEMIAEAVGEKHPVVGMRSGYWIINKTTEQIAFLAERYAKEIAIWKPEGDLVMGGFCVGSIIAAATARRLIDQGRRIAELIVLDPADFAPYPGAATVLLTHDAEEMQNSGILQRLERQFPNGFTLHHLQGGHFGIHDGACNEALRHLFQSKLAVQGVH